MSPLTSAILSEQALFLDFVPPRVVVLGGGVIGVEFASVFKSFGSEVTIVEALPQLTLAQVHAALASYFDHLDEVEAELRAEDGFVLRMAGRYAPHLASARFRPTL